MNHTRYRVGRASAGLGLFATTPFKKGERVIEYTGERISPAEADRRGGQYLFEVSSRTTIDGKGRENTARYLNHSCEPNCESRVERSRVFIYTLRRIEPGEELTYDYGEEFVAEHIGPTGCRCAACQEQRGGTTDRSPEQSAKKGVND
ncbi:SET domain-containing protein-lysine N-methyltransferase [Patescibacteria group bacterium]|jgi:SET domain-containing protein|nr:SET domain-containing protein-lysine N-methyltransferase [Patescibacteria group bacterium]